MKAVNDLAMQYIDIKLHNLSFILDIVFVVFLLIFFMCRTYFLSLVNGQPEYLLHVCHFGILFRRFMLKITNECHDALIQISF